MGLRLQERQQLQQRQALRQLVSQQVLAWLPWQQQRVLRLLRYCLL